MGIEAVQLFNQLPNEILGNCIYVCVLNACAHSGLVHQAKQIFEKIPIQERTNQICTIMVRRKKTFLKQILFQFRSMFSVVQIVLMKHKH
jgi:pentatricopeptide repeat protein